MPSKKNNNILYSLILLFFIVLSLFIFFSFNKSNIIFLKFSKTHKNHRLLDDSNIYNSYSNKKKNNICKYFIDGKDYFQDLYQQLLDAKETIYIADYHLNPELFLIRPVDENIYIEMANKNILTKDLGKNISRLMDILDLKAKEGVKIYILLYHEWVVLNYDSKHTVNVFQKLNKNINIKRFPHDSNNMIWTAHEKLVIIDDIIGYVGGHNLCWGSYDTPQHPLYEEQNENNIYEFPFLDYDNLRIRQVDNSNNYTSKNKLKFNEIRLPWHDIHARIYGPAVEDISRHFLERWNYAVSSESNNNGIIPYIKDILESNLYNSFINYFKTEKDTSKLIKEKMKKNIKKI